MIKILISACLTGSRVRYDGKRIPVSDILLTRWKLKGLLITVCPEVSGGLKTPRLPAQINNGNGLDVLKGKARVMNIKGQNVTAAFIKGAKTTIRLAREYDIKIAVLKEKSPSCGVHRIYDGHFNSRLIPGCGVTAAILKQSGIKVFSESELDLAASFLYNLQHVDKTCKNYGSVFND